VPGKAAWKIPLARHPSAAFGGQFRPRFRASPGCPQSKEHNMSKIFPAGTWLPALAVLAVGAAALHGGPAAQAQSPTFLNFGLAGTVHEPPAASGLEGLVTITCEGNPGQTKSGQFQVSDSTTKGLSANIACEGPVKVEGKVWKQGNEATAVACTPFQLREPSATGINHAKFGRAKADGGNISCTMYADAG